MWQSGHYLLDIITVSCHIESLFNLVLHTRIFGRLIESIRARSQCLLAFAPNLLSSSISIVEVTYKEIPRIISV